MTAPAPLETGRVVAGRYRVEHEIGQGGMGAVYLVRHVHTDESLALKILHSQHRTDAQAVERFKREAKAPARIQSEHVARVTDADTAADLDGNPFYVVMELLRGTDLEKLVKERGALPPEIVVEYMRQTARALDKAHAIGIVHRDLKPENLFLTEREDGTPCIKLLDFGIARLADTEGLAHLQTQAGLVFGTPTYMAPEQAMGEVEMIGKASDIWAFGLVAFKLLVGKPYWSAKTLAHLYGQILTEPLVPASERGSTFGPAFDAWFSKCVVRPPDARFQSAGEAIAQLGAALGVQLAPRSNVSLVSANELDSGRARISMQDGTGPISLRDFRESAPRVSLEGVAPASMQQTAMEVPVARASLSDAQPIGTVAGVPKPSSSRAPLFIGIGALVAVVVIGGGVGIGLKLSSSSAASQGIVASSSAKPDSSAVAATASLASTGTVPSPEPTASAAPEPTAAGTAKVTGHARGTKSAQPAAATAAAPTHAPTREPTRDQRRRMEALQRLCDQGTFTAAECSQKRAAILREGG